MKEGKSFEISQYQFIEAYKRVKANQGAGGVDGIDLKSYEQDLKNNLYKLWNRMSSGSYYPKAVRGVEIPKKDGRKRLLGIPTIEDRVAQMVVRMEFEPLVEPIFYEDSYGYRPNKSALDAVGATRERCWKMPWVLEIDIVGLFDHIDHELTMQVVRKHTDCKWVILYIERFLKAPMVMPDGRVQERTTGTPQGGVISAVLSNLYMHYAFDRWMKGTQAGNPWERYADDAVIHCRSKGEAEKLRSQLEKRMADCKLELHPEKTRIVYCKSDQNRGSHENESFDFLGYTFRIRYVKNRKGEYFQGFNPAASKGAGNKFRERIREIRRQNKAADLKELAKKINPVIRGWSNYFSKYTAREARQVLDEVNLALVQWVQRKYKDVGKNRGRAFRWLARIAEWDPKLFYHWEMGICPTVRLTRAV